MYMRVIIIRKIIAHKRQVYQFSSQVKRADQRALGKIVHILLYLSEWVE